MNNHNNYKLESPVDRSQYAIDCLGARRAGADLPDISHHKLTKLLGKKPKK